MTGQPLVDAFPPGRLAETYGEDFYEQHRAIALRSAEAVVPLVFDLLRPTSVCDVGGGIGIWLAPFARRGCRVLCVDGSWIAPDQLLVPPAAFRAVDLRRAPRIDDRFDLAICLEVAEHLPPRSGRRLVTFLTELAPAVLFSAALPGQGGREHRNERPHSYWRQLFEDAGYVYPVQRHIWQRPDVATYFQQNTRLFVTPALLAANGELRREAALAAQHFPELHEERLIRYRAAGAWSKLKRRIAILRVRLALRRRLEWRGW